MNALTPMPPFPVNPKVGQVFYQWVWNGSAWICQGAGPMAKLQVFQLTGTYFPSPGLTFAIVECVGAGGGGGAALGQLVSPVTVSGWICGGGGGASGGYTRSILAGALVAGGVAVTVGVGGVSSPLTQGTMGTAGSPTMFGQLVTANGGNGAYSNVSTLTTTDPGWGLGGIRPQPGVGDFAVYGTGGGAGNTSFYDHTSGGEAICFGGKPGDGYFATGGRQVRQGEFGSGLGAQGVDGLMAGSGGGGAASSYANSGALGGAGAPGVCLVTEWCFGNTAIVQDCGCGPAGDPCAPCPPGAQGWWTPSL